MTWAASVLLVTGAGALLYLGLLVLLWQRGRRSLSEHERFDAVVVPGCAVHAGGVASPALLRRTLAAVALYRKGRAPRLVLTGGIGRHPPAEAEVARSLALEAGVPEAHLLVEDQSTNTETNASYAARLLPPQSRVLVVTDPYHVLRCERVFGRYFAVARGVAAEAPFRLAPTHRELCALLSYALRGRL